MEGYPLYYRKTLYWSHIQYILIIIIFLLAMGSCSVDCSILAAAVNSKKKIKKNASVCVNVGVCQGSCHTAATVCLIDVVIFILDNNGDWHCSADKLAMGKA